ncbi:MAG: 50S ribosomal protein L25, partial [Patescibacteria group bacterium]
VANDNLSVLYNAFSLAYKAAGESTLVDLKINYQPPIKVLIHDTQINPLTDEIIHIDFYQVSMVKKLEAEIAFNFMGESPVVKNSGGILIKSVDKIKVRCLPGDLVHAIDVDLGALNNFGDVIRIKDIKFPHGMEILERAENVVVSVAEPISEEELKAMDEKPTADVTAIKTEGEEKRAKAETEKTAEEVKK